MSLAKDIAIRRLAAVLAADVAGYSRLMGIDEEGTLARLKAHRHELVDPKIREHRGRIVKTTGDGMLVEFASVVDAVRCAVEVQRALIERDPRIAEDQRIRLRVGINLGDIIADGDDIFGDGVNVAARLETLAEPGGICISGAVREQVGERLGYDFADMGEQSVKNIARPIRAYQLSPAVIAATPLVAAPAPRQPASGNRQALKARPPRRRQRPVPRLSIAVLPFANLSNDREQEDFVDAVTDDLTTDLSRIANSFVIARTTASTYKGKQVDVSQIGRELGVRYVLEGSVRPLGEQLQVNVQLIDAENGAHLWADRFDTDRGDIATAQSDITGRLACTLRAELVIAASRQIELEAPTSRDPRDLIMRGWAAAYYLPVTESSTHQALRLFEQALELDSTSTEAKVAIADVLIQNAIKRWSRTPEQDQIRAEKLLNEALERNGNHVRAHFAMGMLRRLQHRLQEARIEFEKALSLDGNFATAMLQLGYTLNVLGEPVAALPHFEKSLRLSPRHQNIVYQYSGLGYCHLYLSHLDQAVEFFLKARATNSRLFYIHLGLTAALGLKGDLDNARASLADFLKFQPELNSLARVCAWARPGNPTAAAIHAKTLYAGLRRAGMPEE